MTAKDALFIFFNEGIGHIETPGLSFYGLFKQNTYAVSDADKFFNSLEIASVYHLNSFEEDDYFVLIVDISIKIWPSDHQWFGCLKEILGWFLKQGASLSWCGDETCSPNPEILRPGNSAGNVYAVLTDKTIFLCNSNLNDELEYISDSQLEKIGLF